MWGHLQSYSPCSEKYVHVDWILHLAMRCIGPMLIPSFHDVRRWMRAIHFPGTPFHHRLPPPPHQKHKLLPLSARWTLRRLSVLKVYWHNTPPPQYDLRRAQNSNCWGYWNFKLTLLLFINKVNVSNWSRSFEKNRSLWSESKIMKFCY